MALSPSAPLAPVPLVPDRDARLRAAAERLEAGFIKQMLQEAGLGRAPAGFGGGDAEGQWGSFLLDAQAEGIARAGGLGLAESLFEALARDAR